jgi:predicted TIM-barrel fold metal-dependent hydrolase
MPRQLIDIHPHVISSDTASYPVAPLGGVRSAWSRERPVDWPALSLAMDEAGVHKAAVVQSSTTYGHDNSYLADCVDQAPDRITGVCSVGFLDQDVLDRVSHWIDERGMSGLRLFTTGSTMSQASWLDDDRTKKAWAHVAERGIPTCVQITMSAIPQLVSILGEFPGLRVVLDHVAMADFTDGPPYTGLDQVYRLADWDGVFLKVTSRTLGRARASGGGAAGALRELVARFGSERIAWGSNYPANEGSMSSLVELLEEGTRGLPERDVDNIYHGTALALYPKLG